MSPELAPAGSHDHCAQQLYDALGRRVTINTVPPPDVLRPLEYVARCPHGITFYVDPTRRKPRSAP